ncbi:MAG: hypothetical protein PWR15_1029 [Bacteroidota bacterium]|jgi:hypothetical protein|nr:hypothetical protein [Bacteroidota bacterium]
MDEPQKYDFTKLTNLESIKEFCNSHLFDIATGGLKTENHSVKVRFIDSDRKFGYTGLGRFFFVDDCMYIISRDKKYESDHNPNILDFSEELDILKFSGDFIVRVIFAGVFTGFYDDKGERIFTGDVVSAKMLLNPTIPSNGGRNRARNFDNETKGIFCEAGVNEIFENFSIILDNHSVPLSWATELEIVGSLFFELEKGETEVDIQSLCSSFAQSRTDRNELKRLIKKSPYFPPVTWQEKALEILCGDNNEENEDRY